MLSIEEQIKLENEKSKRFDDFENLKYDHSVAFENLRHENTMKELELQLKIAEAQSRK